MIRGDKLSARVRQRISGAPPRALRAGAAGVIAAAALPFLAAPALAHGFAPIPPEAAWRFWSLDPLVIAPLMLSHWLYGRGLAAWRRRLGRRPEGLPAWRVACFLAGELVLLAALASPIDAVSETILSAHMTQHVLLIALAPPLLVLGRPEWAWAAGLPASWRGSLLASRAARNGAAVLSRLARPLPATLLHGGALWVWHAPILFEAGRANEWMHALEHATFFGTALLFWRALVAAAESRSAAAAGMAAALATLVHGGFLSALIGLAREPLYPASTVWAPIWGMTPLEDQQLAGAIMWVPAGAAYLVAGIVIAARLVSPDRAGVEPVGGGPLHPAREAVR